MANIWARFAVAISLLLGAASVATAGDAKPSTPSTQPVVFNRDIRPFLSDTCFKCHGMDASARKAKLRLDTLAGATADMGSGHGAIVPGKPEESEAYQRLISDDPEEKMPPPKSGLVLTPQQVELFKKWIEQGAVYQPHWSLIKPVAAPLPETKNSDWARNGIDHFVLARLEQENLHPSPEADRITLLRRVTLDLTGLPPTPAEVDSFLSDESTNAYEKVVDRLLGSQRYGERMALRWLDLARYGDTNGYQVDTDRAQWRWRDWVIDAFNNNERFDQFTIDQLAGDLLPNATLDQKMASGFNRNHRITLEGGVIPEEYRVEYVIDRVETTSATWLGMTMGCARCHDHKYDPITQKEFYKFFAFFNQVPENGIDGGNLNSAPFIPAPVGAARGQLEKLETKLAAAQARMDAMQPQITAGETEWQAYLPHESTPAPVRNGLINYYPLDGDAVDAAVPCRGGDFRGGAAAFADGVFGQSAAFDGKTLVDLGDAGRFEKNNQFSISAWVHPKDDCDSAVVGRIDEKHDLIGYNLYWLRGQVFLQIIHKVPDSFLGIVSAQPVSANAWHHLTATYDGSGKAAGAKLYVDGKPIATTVQADTLSGSSVAKAVPLQIGGRGNGVTRFRGQIDDVRLYNRVLAPGEIESLGGTAVIAAHVPATQRSADQFAAIRQEYLNHAPPEQRDAIKGLDTAAADRKKLVDTLPTIMVMEDMKTPRDTFILKRGQYDQPTDKVTAGTPACLPPLPADAPANRLTLARWLVDPANPLPARVTVNRFWEMYFGTGIVKTTEDLGSQSEWPSHPELLDWLAVQFIQSGWDVKAMQKLIVTSATYRQDSRVTPELLEKDPANRLLARGSRVRLPAEAIRDQALAVSGLLVEKLGGPSVRPYQPPGLWEELTSGGLTKYVQDHGEALYRRSMYTWWKRTIPPPTMSVFDAPTRETCTIRRSRTNTPLQALALWNDTIYVEASRKLAERAMSEGGGTTAARISQAFRLVVCRKPSDAELKILVDDFDFHLSNYFAKPDEATKLLAVGESPRNPNLDPRELAAYTAVSSVILNMDQTITRE